LYMCPRKGYKVVFFQKVINTLPQELRNDTNVISVVKAFQEMYTSAKESITISVAMGAVRR
jgi:hypothetical protein